MSSSPRPDGVDVPVVIAGGGLVGLSLAMFLAQHGVASMCVERLRGGSLLPRAAHFHLRTLELFRLAGVEAEVIEQSAREFLPEGAIIAMDSLAGAKLADIIASLNDGVDAVSPCRRLFISQPGLEPILRRRAQTAGASVLDGHDVVAFDELGSPNDPNGSVRVVVRDVDTGAERSVRARYLVGADGAHSTVRDVLGVEMDGRGTFSKSMTIYFVADLWPVMGDKPLSVIYINNARFGGFFRLAKDCQSGFLVVNTVRDANGNALDDAAVDTSPERLVELVRLGAGVPDLDVTITGIARWRATSDNAARYQRGRVFLAGDAAHLMPPNGGFGGNTGIHDAHNLASKLALVLNGVAPPRLLDRYEAERRPVGRFTVEQAYTRYVLRTAPHLGADTAQPLEPDFHVEIGYVYGPPDATGSCAHDDPRALQGCVGARAPHVWLTGDAGRSSTIDLTGQSFVLFTRAEGGRWRDAATHVARTRPNLPFQTVTVTTANGDAFAEMYGVDNDGMVLVRPDGFVTARSDTMTSDPSDTLASAIIDALE